METTDSLKTLKTVARKIARARQEKHVVALNAVARAVGFPHWYDLAAAEKAGWRPSEAHQGLAQQLLDVPATEGPILVGDPFGEHVGTGKVSGHRYTLYVALDDVFMDGRGWRIKWPECPSAAPKATVTDRRFKDNPVLDPEFLALAFPIGEKLRRQVHANLSTAWPRRATKTDAEGRVRHPFNGSGLSEKWYCLHCDHEASGAQIAANLWHCPACCASPVNIHSRPWWLD